MTVQPNPVHPMNELSAELARLRRDNKRLRGWLRYLLQQHGDSGTMRDGFVVGDCLDALKGKPAPKVSR